MSILIKGMEMPPKGHILSVVIQDGKVIGSNSRKVLGKDVIEVPKHGRLIDADALMEKAFRYQIHGKPTLKVVLASALRDAPTIIEAEPDCSTCKVKGKACKVFYRDKGDNSVCRELREVEEKDG